jgi:hypothetical protein
MAKLQNDRPLNSHGTKVYILPNSSRQLLYGHLSGSSRTFCGTPSDIHCMKVVKGNYYCHHDAPVDVPPCGKIFLKNE